MYDYLRPLLFALDAETAHRLTLYALGRRPRLWREAPARGRSFKPDAAAHAIYEVGRRRQEKLYDLLLPPAGEPEHAKPSGPDGPASGVAGSSPRRKGLRSRAARR